MDDGGDRHARHVRGLVAASDVLARPGLSTRSRLHRLESLRLKLETIRLKQAWDEEFRSRRPRPDVSDRKGGGHEDR